MWGKSGFIVCILIDKKYHWRYLRADTLECWYIGSETAVKQFVTYLGEHPDAGMDELKGVLTGLCGNFAFIVEKTPRIVAAVDKIRSYPIFYYHERSQFQISNSARALKNELKLDEIDGLSLLEFCMAGYVSGRETIYNELFQLQAGEFLVWNALNRKIDLGRCYQFYSESSRQEREQNLIEELDTITDRIFIRITEEAEGRPIRVPLSGGLDSRLVLCKLKALGYDDLAAFSYGPTGNYEAKAAQYVAKALKVPWSFLHSSRRIAKKYFHSDFRKSYWAYSDGLCSLPYTQDIEILGLNIGTEAIPENAIIINGNSGDFISGGHIPNFSDWGRGNWKSFLLNSIVKKHYSLWLDLTIPANLEKIKEKVKNVLNLNAAGFSAMGFWEACKYYELWEWQERQAKYVINGQRNYDFMKLGWFLPLWDDDYLRFWSEIPVTMKMNQKLYKDYLSSKDFFGVFKGFPFTVWRWPGAMVCVVPLVRALKVLLGSEVGDKAYRIFSYWGHYGNLYAQYGFRHFLKHCFDSRGYNSLNAKQWLKEEGIEEF
jgi:asparagine synthase (glutamine-hydrolysing)